MTIVIDNCGYDKAAMQKLTEKQFVDTHLPNDALARGRTEDERKKYLKDVYAIIKTKDEEKPKN